MAKALSFEEKLKRLEDIAENMQDSGVPLKESVAMYEEGITLIKALKKELSAAEEKVKILTIEAGEPVMKNYE